jgi:citrate synthase
MGEQLDARAAAQRLGVDVRTLYAYVSRGSLRRVPGPDGRSSRYDSDDLELLAQRSRPRTLPRPAASIDLVIATRVSTVTDGAVRYRGRDVLDLVAAGVSFEHVADLLWRDDSAGWPQSAQSREATGVFLEALGTSVPVLQRFAIAIAALPASPASPAPPALPASPALRESILPVPLPQAEWAAYGRRLIACLTGVGGAPAAPERASAERAPSWQRESVAGRLWERWSPLRPTAERARALNTALVLLAEHELAVSTLSVRVAASARATPRACVLAGLSTLSGALHGGAARALHEMLAARAAGGQPELLPQAVGFGHPVHRHGDPRTGPLLAAVYGYAAQADRDLIESVRQSADTAPNLDLGLAALTYTARMPAEAATAIFAIARTAGWIAHAAEESGEAPLRFRGRAFRSRTTPGRGSPFR